MLREIKSTLINIFRRIQLRLNGVDARKQTVFSNVYFRDTAVIEPFCRLIGSPKIHIGSNFYINCNCHLLGEINIGDNVLIGPQTVIWGRDHGIKKNALICNQEHLYAPINIGNDVWIGANVTILKGVTIGNGAVIGAGSVVVKDIPSNAIAVGNPARTIRERT
jgi:maltose O-acetyltransferase